MLGRSSYMSNGCRKLHRWIFPFIIFSFISNVLIGQESESDDSSLSAFDVIDTLFIDRDLKNWSFRFYGNLKEQRVSVSNGDSKVALVPNNPFGIGIGFANKKLVIDVGFNLKPDENATDRFDLQGSYIYGHHQVGFFFQHYQGFRVENEEANTSTFRDDVLIQSAGLRYIYLFNPTRYSFSSLRTGLSHQKRSSHSFGVGGFLLQIQQEADSTFVDRTFEPTFNSQAEIVNSSSVALGGSLAFSTILVISKNLFFGLSVAAGAGVNYHEIKTETETFTPDNPLVYQVGVKADLVYNFNRVYANLSLNNSSYGTDLDFGNRGLYNQFHAKLVLGLKYEK